MKSIYTIAISYDIYYNSNSHMFGPNTIMYTFIKMMNNQIDESRVYEIIYISNHTFINTCS